MGVVPGRALSGPDVAVLRAAKVGGSEPDDHLLRVRSLDSTGCNRSASRVRAADAPRSSGRGPRRAGGKSGELVPFLLRCYPGTAVGSGNVLGAYPAHGTGPDPGRSAAADHGGYRLRPKPVGRGSCRSAGGPRGSTSFGAGGR